MSRLRVGTFFFFQAAPGQRHEDIIRNELTQVEWSEEVGSIRPPSPPRRRRGRGSGLTRRCTRCA